MREPKLNKKVSDWINTIGFAYKRLGHIHNKGHPDVTGCINGIRIELEGKIPGKKPTPLQASMLRKWEAAGAITGVYHSLEEAKEIVIKGLKQYGITGIHI